MSNYPDDIRNYDHDPRSPFYEEWHCPICGGHENDVDCTPEYCETNEEHYDPTDP